MERFYSKVVLNGFFCRYPTKECKKRKMKKIKRASILQNLRRLRRPLPEVHRTFASIHLL
jgi:hypothetical protein